MATMDTCFRQAFAAMTKIGYFAIAGFRGALRVTLAARDYSSFLSSVFSTLP